MGWTCGALLRHVSCEPWLVFVGRLACVFSLIPRPGTDGPDSNELVADLTEKLLAGKKSEVFGFLQTLPAARAQRLKEKLITSLKKVPAATTRGSDAALGPRPDSERPKSTIEKKTMSSEALQRPRANSLENAGKKSSASANNSTPASPLAAAGGGRQTRSVCGGRYLIGECVGRGNFGKVYNALDKNTGQFVAVKEIGCSNFGKAAINAIMLEADLLSSLDHKNIVKNLEVDQTEDHIFFVMELISSGSLYETLTKFGTLTEQLCVIYIVQVMRGLRYLHGRGLTHGDIKADNILLTKEGKVKLVDFGTSAMLNAKQESALGTPFWMAPEVINMEGAVTTSDVWSLGCTIIELVSGKPPYYDVPAMTAMFKMVEDRHPPLPQGISPELSDFLLQCFTRNPRDRPSCAQLLQHPWIVGLKPASDSSDEEQDSKRHSTGTSVGKMGRGGDARRGTGGSGGYSKGDKQRVSPRDVMARRMPATDEELLAGLDKVESVEYQNGDRYKGQLNVHGKRHGVGVYTMKNGTVYRGDFKMGKPHGFGEYRYPNKDVYTGQFKHDLFHGFGRYEAASGMTHEGEYKDGKRHGNGTMTASNGSSFTGGYLNDLMEGFGVYKYASGDVYKGMFKANKFEGQGCYYFASNGSKIEGEFSEGKPKLKTPAK